MSRHYPKTSSRAMSCNHGNIRWHPSKSAIISKHSDILCYLQTCLTDFIAYRYSLNTYSYALINIIKLRFRLLKTRKTFANNVGLTLFAILFKIFEWHPYFQNWKKPLHNGQTVYKMNIVCKSYSIFLPIILDTVWAIIRHHRILHLMMCSGSTLFATYPGV